MHPREWDLAVFAGLVAGNCYVSAVLPAAPHSWSDGVCCSCPESASVLHVGRHVGCVGADNLSL